MRKKYQKKIKEKCTEAVIFARVSSEKQEKGASIEAQKELIYNYCKSKNLKIIKEYEITESTTRGDRKKYNDMLDYIQKRNKKTAIVVNCVDRLQRSDEDNPRLNKLRKLGKIEIHFMKENIILDDNSPVTDVFAWKMNVLMAGNYTDSLSYNVKRSFNLNWSQGKWQGFAPLGYLNRRDDENKATLILDPVRAPIVKKLFEAFASGNYSTVSIWKLAKELGLKSKIKKYKDNFVSRNTIYDILTNPFYYGQMFINNEFIKHQYEPLIDKDLFDKVQKILIHNGNHNRNNTSEYAKEPYIFRGLIKCKECGCHITPEKHIKNGKEYIYLRCGHPGKICHQPLVNENIILDQLKTEIFDKITLPANLQKALINELTIKLQDTTNINKNMKLRLTKQINELSIKEERLLDLYIDGKIKDDDYNKKKSKLANEIETLKESQDKLIVLRNDIKDKVCNIVSCIGNIYNIFEKATVTQKSTLLKLLISNIYLDDKRIEYTINKPFDKFIDVPNYKKWTDITIENIEELEEIEI